MMPPAITSRHTRIRNAKMQQEPRRLAQRPGAKRISPRAPNPTQPRNAAVRPAAAFGPRQKKQQDNTANCYMGGVNGEGNHGIGKEFFGDARVGKYLHQRRRGHRDDRQKLGESHHRERSLISICPLPACIYVFKWRAVALMHVNAVRSQARDLRLTCLSCQRSLRIRASISRKGVYDDGANSSMSTGPMATLSESFRILRPFWPMAAFATLAGSLSGLASAALLATINRAVHTQGEVLLGILATFAGLSIVSVAGEFFGNLGNNLVGQKILAKLRKELSVKIITAPIFEIERFQSYRLLAVLNHDVATIGAFTFNFSMIAIAFSIAVGCFVYLAILSPVLFIVAIAAVVLVFGGQAVATKLGAKPYSGMRNAHDELQKHYRAIIEGAKEIQINEQRRLKVIGQLTSTIEQIGNQFVQATRTFFAARAFNSVLFYIALLVVLALGTRMQVENTAVSGFILVMLYVRGPIEQIVSAMPLFGEAQASFQKVAELSAAIAKGEPCSVTTRSPAMDFSGGMIEMRNVRYEFPTPDEGEPFVLGPVNLKINAGETLFIVGKNGCGKTTLIKLLVGLYTPQQGELLCDGKQIQPIQLDSYRQLFSAVFFDYYLFDDLIASDVSTLRDVDHYLRLLKIEQKVTVRDGAFSTIDLSTGQRKRLALIHVFLDRRPIVVLDEWAADQDPSFRRFFYEELLPDLKRQGKTLIVVSHDDSYFHAADRIIGMDAGVIDDRQRTVDTSLDSPIPLDIGSART